MFGALGMIALVTAGQTDWPQWRGPHGDARIAEAKPPLRWSATEGILWKTPLPGAGNGCPIVVGGKVILTATDGANHDNLMVLAFDQETGNSVWKAGFFASRAAAPFAMFPPERGHAAPSPASDGKTVVALFGSGDIGAVDLDGNLLWFRSLARDNGPFRNEYGISASPLIVEDKVLVQIDHAASSYLLALSLKTGEVLWKQPRDALDNWATPVAARVDGTTQIICLGTQKATGYDLKDGSVLWTHSGLERLCSATPTVRGSKLYLTSGPRGVVFALELAGTPKGSSPRILWQTKKIGPFVPSPVLTEKQMLVPDDQGMLTGLDLATGKELWKERMAGRARPSPVVAGDLLYHTSLDGVTTVAKVGERLEKLASNSLGEQVAASPALASGRLYIRGEKHLWCVGR